MKPQPTMTPKEEAEWLKCMSRGELPPGPFWPPYRTAKKRLWEEARRRRELDASHQGKREQGRFKVTSAPPCPPHHWKIPEANGPTSVGVCLKCGDQREFRNSVPDARDRAILRLHGVKGVGRLRQGGAARISERPPGWTQGD